MSRGRQRPRRRSVERYEITSSPLAQRPTQKDLANLVGVKKTELLRIVAHKELYIVRRKQIIRGKERDLRYPRGKLRRIHERLKFHLGKIKLPPYIYAPRVGRSQRDNALLHISQTQYFKFDVRQFYPSTTRTHIKRWAIGIGMPSDVASLFADIVTVDGAVSFGSPVTPVLVALVHRQMFDEISRLCDIRGLKMSVWVDDVIISGRFVPGVIVSKVRDILQKNGLAAHKLEYLSGARPVPVTGIYVHRDRLNVPNSMNLLLKERYEFIQSAQGREYHAAVDRILNALGTMRQISGRSSVIGQRVSGRMASLRRRREQVSRDFTTMPDDQSALNKAGPCNDSAPF